MSTHRTTNHEEIREWVEKNGGHPAIIAGVESPSVVESEEGSEGELTLVFDDIKFGARKIEWPEFFDTFEQRQLQFCYDNPLKSGESALHAYDFEDRDTETDTHSDETELPDAVDDVLENMFPSAPREETRDI